LVKPVAVVPSQHELGLQQLIVVANLVIVHFDCVSFESFFLQFFELLENVLNFEIDGNIYSQKKV